MNKCLFECKESYTMTWNPKNRMQVRTQTSSFFIFWHIANSCLGPLTLVSSASFNSWSNLTLAAELKTIETSSTSNCISEAEIPSPGKVMSPAMATILSSALGWSNQANTCTRCHCEATKEKVILRREIVPGCWLIPYDGSQYLYSKKFSSAGRDVWFSGTRGATSQPTLYRQTPSIR